MTADGKYAVAADLAPIAHADYCFRILSSGVQLDCQGHSIPGIDVEAPNVTITNCIINHSDSGHSLLVARTQNITVSDSTFSISSSNGGVLVRESSFVTLSDNVLNSSSTTVLADGLTTLGALISLSGGGHNRVLQNVIDGGWDGSPNAGTDDGILVGSESDDVIQDNTIKNVYDAGIEPVGSLTTTMISKNNLSRCGIAGIGAYWGTAWQGVSVIGNKISQSPHLLVVTYNTAPGKSTTPELFQNNEISGNVFRNPLVPRVGYSMFINLGLMQSAIGGNLIKGNDFGTENLGPFVTPLAAFIDGGGNVCAKGGNLQCSVSGPGPSIR